MAGLSFEFVPSAGGGGIPATTAADGTYSVRLSPGTYQARTNRGGRGQEPVQVVAGRPLRLDLTFDVGIR